MKLSPSSSPLLSFCYLHTLTLAALSVVSPHPANAMATLNSTTPPPNPARPPLDPTQLRVHGTTTSLVFGKYTAPVSPFDLVGIVEKAQFEIVQSVVKARGDAPIAQPTFEWRHGRLYVRVEHELALTWLVMAEALHGLRDFGDEYGFWGLSFTVLDDTAGIVGSGSVGVGYT
ncbi:hypothetical protein HO173_005891 [Letharia columbiana]|uniref:Uncharacterized protein n=1 Tax=Letharia columbiana TaxID=112416 RepID=A0A8H6FWU2_9LECA|nr:uncharacterized protein HO173_005891 [Letharia columbiana]KAF6236260.1 hypothetical protein HO173_005891 [Letharia columbiana]